MGTYRPPSVESDTGGSDSNYNHSDEAGSEAEADNPLRTSPAGSPKPQDATDSPPDTKSRWTTRTFNSTVNTARSWLNTTKSWLPSLSSATWGVIGGTAITALGASTAYMTGPLGEGGLSSVALATATNALLLGTAGWAYGHDWKKSGAAEEDKTADEVESLMPGTLS